jgi:hypothetical protein
MAQRIRNMLALILPVLFPSWRFFSRIDASPRIEYAFLQNEYCEPLQWHALRPLPARLTFFTGLSRLLWNPQWNETLYMNSCAEHLFAGAAPIREQDIMHRLLAAMTTGEIAIEPDAQFLVFCIRAVIRDGNIITQPIVFIAKPSAIPAAIISGTIRGTIRGNVGGNVGGIL